MKRGYIKLWRKIWDHPFWREKRVFSRAEAWIDLIMMANGKDKEILFDGKPVLIKRGQLLTSQRQLAERWRWSKTKTRDFLNSLRIKSTQRPGISSYFSQKCDHSKTTEFSKFSPRPDHSIEIYSDRKKSIITFSNYMLYNPLPDEKKTTENDEKKTTERPLKDNRLAPTNKVKIKINKDNIENIIAHWNSKNIRNLEDRETKVKTKTLTKINSSLKDYSLTEIIEAVNNYHVILESEEHYFSYKWQLWEFLDRGLVKFLTKNNPFDNYLRSKKDKDQTSVGSQRLFSKEDEKYFSMIDKEYEEKLQAYMEKEGITNEDDVDPFKFPTRTDFRTWRIREIKKEE